jgi:hypothetical protein
MKRVHLFEFTDLPWYPQTFQRIQTDYLQFVATRGSGHKNLVPLLIKGLQFFRRYFCCLGCLDNFHYCQDAVDRGQGSTGHDG